MFGLSLRQTEGFLLSLQRLLELAIEVPHYSTYSRRAAALAVPKFARPIRGGPLYLAIDGRRGRKTVRGTVFPDDGLKVHGEGEWKVCVHCKARRRVWRKLHLAVDTRTGELQPMP